MPFAKILITKVSLFKLILIIFNFYILVRIKCNRCGRGNSNLFNQQNPCPNVNNFLSQESIIQGDLFNSPYFLNKQKEFSFSPSPNNKNNYKDKGDKGNKKNNKNKKPFIERPGDWICYNCQNLNFAFRNNCNRCHLSKEENKKNLEKYDQQ